MDVSGKQLGTEVGEQDKACCIGGLSCPVRPMGCFVAGAPHKADHSLGIYI